MSELYLSDVTLRESRPRSRRLRDLGYVVRSYPETAPVSTASGSILDTILIPHYDDAGNLVSLESTVDFWSSKNISAGGLAAGGGGDGLTWSDLGTDENERLISARRMRLSSDGSVYTDDFGFLHANVGSGGGNVSTSGTWTKDRIVVSGANNTVKSEYGIEWYDVTMNSGLIPTSYAVKTYVDAHSGGGGGYTLPTATTTRLGGVKVGAGLSVAPDGTLSYAGGGGTSGITEDYANSRYIRRDGTNVADEKIIFVKGIHIGPANGGIDITYDATTNAIKINGNAYAVGQLAAGVLISSNN